MTDGAGTVVWDRVATPFGVEVSTTGSLAQPLRFPGQTEDVETALNQNWNRDYDPLLGRYIQSDPIGLMGGINTYAYVNGNPLMAIDPDGLNPWAIRAGFRGAAALGGAAGRAAAPAIARGLVRAGIVKGFTITPDGQIIPGDGTFSNDNSDEAGDRARASTGSQEGSCSGEEDDAERCKRIKQQCIDGCSDFVLQKPSRYRKDLGGMDFHRCVRQCLDRNGC